MRPLSDGTPLKWKSRSVVRLTYDETSYCVGDAPCKRNQRIVVKAGLTFLF